MNDATRSKFLDPAQRIYADSMKKKYVNGGYGVNGTVPNGHVPNAYTKMNINVNPLSDVDMPPLCNGHGGNNQYQVSLKYLCILQRSHSNRHYHSNNLYLKKNNIQAIDNI